jgi:hypothetical protein
MRRMAWVVLMAALPNAARAAVLDAGPGTPFPQPSTAIAAAHDGDTVRVAPGIYRDCATIRLNRFTLEAAGGPVILRGATCGGKAILIIAGASVTIRGLTLEGARVPDGNGAGIRAEGGDLLIERTTFINNENGLLSADGHMTIHVADSAFIGDGTCRLACAHGIYVGKIDRLTIERTRFLSQREGHHIKSRARLTEVRDSDIDDGPDGTSSYLVDLPNGGAAVITGNRLRKGPLAGNPVAISIGEEGSRDTAGDAITITGNAFTSDFARPVVFVRNGGRVPAVLSANRLTGRVTPLSGPGAVGP